MKESEQNISPRNRYIPLTRPIPPNKLKQFKSSPLLPPQQYPITHSSLKQARLDSKRTILPKQYLIPIVPRAPTLSATPIHPLYPTLHTDPPTVYTTYTCVYLYIYTDKIPWKGRNKRIRKLEERSWSSPLPPLIALKAYRSLARRHVADVSGALPDTWEIRVEQMRSWKEGDAFPC